MANPNEPDMQNPVPPYTPEQLREMRRKDAKFLANGGIFICGCGSIVFGWYFIPLPFGLRLFLIAIVIGVLLIPAIYKKWKRTGRGKWLLNLVRTVSIVLMTVLIGAPILFKLFAQQPFMYPLRRACFLRAAILDNTQMILPKNLPEVYEDYFYYADGRSLSTPSGSRHSILCFHTDDATLQKYEESFASIPEMNRLSNLIVTEEELEE